VNARPTARCVAVAYSGGRDSSALLHATLAAAEGQGLAVVALHVHHGLSERADAWLAHCERQCRHWAARGRPLAFAAQRLAGQPARGESVEAWARRERYAALRVMALAHGARLVLLAHHEQDQAETFLLQALRGGGIAGLAAMPREVQRNGITWARPWLRCSAAEISAYVRRYRIGHIDDDSNADPRFARNRLRLAVWPALQREFAQAARSIADSAAWAHEARACAEALAALDLERIASPQGLDLVAWAALAPEARRSNALRAFIKSLTGRAAPGTLIQRLLVELPGTVPARWHVGEAQLLRYRGLLTLVADTKPTALLARQAVLCVARAGTYRLGGWGGRLRIASVTGGGVARAHLAQLRLAARVGGEDFQIAPDRPVRSLKKCFQAFAMPASQRSGPLVYAGERLLFVPGLGIDARALAVDGQPQIAFEWLNDAA
jgi:tRNA(Ile)-lysidine synthase